VAGSASASFKYSDTKAGTPTITVADESGTTDTGLIDAIQVETVTPGAASKLGFSTQASNTTAGISIAPAVTVQVQDTYGNAVTTGTGSNASISLALSCPGGCGSTTLGGTKTAIATAGVATFSNLSINTAGTGYTLSASSTGLSGATSNSFNITGGTATQFAVSGFTTSGGGAAPQQSNFTV